MNNRIRELAEQSEVYTEEDMLFADILNARYEKFAELIIGEHLSIWDQMDNGNSVHGYTEMEDYPLAVVKHFGVKW